MNKDEYRYTSVLGYHFYYKLSMNLLLCTQSSGPDHRVNPDKHRRASFLFPESTQEFEQLPLEFRVSVGLLLQYTKEHI